MRRWWKPAYVVSAVVLLCACVSRVSVSTSGAQLDGPSHVLGMSASGRLVLFESGATNVVPNDTNGQGDLFVRDTRANTVRRVDLAADGSQTTSGSNGGTIDASGRYVVFETDDALVPSDTNLQADLYRRDLQTGTVALVSLGPDGSQFPHGNCCSGPFDPAITGGGNLIAFDGYTADGPPPRDSIYLRDVAAGTTTKLTDSGQFTTLFISRDGKHLAYNTGCFQAGGCSPRPGVIDLANGARYHPIAFCEFDQVAGISSNGRYVLRNESGGDHVECFNSARVEDRLTATSIELDPENPNRSVATSFSPDGRFVSLVSGDLLVPGDTNGVYDIVSLDTRTGQYRLVSDKADGTPSNGDSSTAFVSDDGRRIAFESKASNLVDGDTNGSTDVFLDAPPRR
jgi:Tol biopolymer transport system component